MNESDKIWMYREMAQSKNRQYDTPIRLVAIYDLSKIPEYSKFSKLILKSKQ